MKPKTPSPQLIVFSFLNVFLSLIPLIGSALLISYCHYLYKLSDNYLWMACYQLHWALLLGPVSLLSACSLVAGKRMGWSGSVISGVSGLLLLCVWFGFLLQHLYSAAGIIIVILFAYQVLNLFYLWKQTTRAYYKISTQNIHVTLGILFVLFTGSLLAFHFVLK